MYSPVIKEHSFHPRHRREMENPDAVGEASYHRCGDNLKMYFRIQEDIVKEVTFTARGCAPVIAAASVAGALLTGLSLEEARRFDAFQLHEALGGLPVSKRHALLLVLECLAGALGARGHVEAPRAGDCTGARPHRGRSWSRCRG